MLRGVGKLKQGLLNRKNSETMKDQTYFREISAKPVMKVPPSPSLCLFSLSSYTFVQKSGNSIFPKDPLPIRIFGGMVVRGGWMSYCTVIPPRDPWKKGKGRGYLHQLTLLLVSHIGMLLSRTEDWKEEKKKGWMGGWG